MSTPATGALVISLDFELYWGVRDRRSLASYRAHLLGVRTVVPALLGLFKRFEVRATWATVGFLFCESRQELFDVLPSRRPRYGDRRLDPYAYLDAVGRDERSDPFHFAPSLIRMVAATDGQEIGSHTFSHFYALEEGQDLDSFRADLEAAREVARRRELDITSLVFPRNQVNRAYLPTARSLGFTAFRGTERSALYTARPERRESRARRALRLVDAYVDVSAIHGARLERPAFGSPVDLPAARFLRPANGLRELEQLRLHRILHALTRSAKDNLVYHLWWHPHNFGADPARNLAFLERVLAHFAVLRRERGIESCNMGDLAQQMGVLPLSAAY